METVPDDAYQAISNNDNAVVSDVDESQPELEEYVETQPEEATQLASTINNVVSDPIVTVVVLVDLILPVLRLACMPTLPAMAMTMGKKKASAATLARPPS